MAEASYRKDRLLHHFACGCGKSDCTRCLKISDPFGCELNCKLCQFDPDVAIPYLTGQRDNLRKVLKELWDRIYIFLEWGVSDKWFVYYNIRKSASELEMLLRLCPFTRFYLDSEFLGVGAEGWACMLLQSIQHVQDHNHSCTPRYSLNIIPT